MTVQKRRYGAGQRLVKKVGNEMAEQRLIDANALQKEFEWLESVVCSCRKDDVADSLQRVKNAQTIDPETLPIVQNLRKELARVTAERDAAICLCGKLIALCSPPKEWVPKLFRRHINRPGDYMGSGYDFLDSFNRIFDNFVETADDEFYTAICGAAEKEILERKQKMAGKKEE